MGRSNNITFRASSSLMEDYRIGSEITTQTAITQLVNAANESELFYTGRNDRRQTVIYNVRPDQKSDTGWSVDQILPDFGFPGQVAGGISGGVFTLFCVGPDTSNPNIYYSQRATEGGPWGPWTNIDPSSVFDTVPQPCYVQSIGAETVDGVLELAAVLADGDERLTLWRVDWNGSLGGWRQLGSVDSPLVNLCSTLSWGPGILGVRMNEQQPAALDLLLFPLDGAAPVTMAREIYFRYLDSALLAPGQGSASRYSGIFFYNDGLSGGSAGTSFIDCSVAQPEPVVIDTTTKCRQIAAVSAGVNPISLMSLDIDSRLSITKHKLDGRGWEHSIELGTVLHSITAGLNALGEPVIFGLDMKAGALFSMQQQRLPESGQWVTQLIEAQAKTVEKLQVYGTVLTLMDAEGNLLRDQAVTVSSPYTTTVLYQGESFLISEHSGAGLKTDANGQVTLYAPTGNINASKLIFSVPGMMADDEIVVVDPDDHARETLETLSEDDTRKLLPEEFKDQAGAVHKAVSRAMSFKPDASVLRQHKGARLLREGDHPYGFERPLDLSCSGGGNWYFSVSDGQVSFRDLSEAEAADLMTKLRTTDREFNFLSDLGDMVVAVKDAAVTKFEYAVNEAYEAVIKFDINRVTFIFDQTITTAERAFQVAETIFASVKVFFEELFDFIAWLLSDAREDIWKTKKVFEKVIDESFASLTDLANQGKSAAGGFFAGLKQTVSENFDTVIADVGNFNFNYTSAAFQPAFAGGGLGPEGISPGEIIEKVYDATVKANWLLDKFFSPMAVVDVKTSIPKTVETAFTNFSAALTESIGDNILQEIDDVSKSLADIAKDPGSFMNSTISAVLKTAKNLTLLVLDILDALSRAFLDLAIAFLQAAKEGIFDKKIGGFLQFLYDKVLNPEDRSEDLTVTRLVAIVCAFPATILYRAITGRAPYPAENAGSPAAGPETDPQKLIGAMVMMMVWSVIDARADGTWVDPLGPKGLILLSSTPVIVNALLCPGNGHPFAQLPDNNRRNLAANVFWGMKWIPASYAFMYSALSGFTIGARKDKASCIILAVLGFPVLGTGIWKGIEETRAGEGSAANWFLNIAVPLVTILKPLRFVAPPKGPAALAVVDLVGDMGGAAINIAKYY